MDHAPADCSARSRRWGLIVPGLALLPALAALWVVPAVVTQDGPAHLYNAEIIARSGDPGSPFRAFYDVRWTPLPNWAGHLLTTALVATLPARVADRLITSLTLVGFAASIVWLRRRVAGWRGMPVAALLAVLLALNLSWLLGFTSFLLGACLFPITLGTWWAGRERFGWPRVAALAGLVVVGYFCHVVSLGLTVGGVAVLALLTPDPRRLARLGRTAVGLLPVVPLGLLYLSQSQRGGRMRPVWEHLTNPLALASWAKQLSWVDPITLAGKDVVPLTGLSSRAFGLLAPVVWLTLGILIVGLGMVLRSDPERDRGRNAWGVLALLLLAGGAACFDSLGANHGDYLQQRLVLLGLVALVPALDFRGGTRLAAGALIVALAVQSAVVWDYALTSHRTAGEFQRVRSVIGRDQRVATLLINIRGRFRANPLLHADCLLGLGTGNIIWSNYETRYYYFPVQFRAGLDRPDAAELELVAISDDPREAAARAALWERLLTEHHQAIDAVVVWGDDPRLDAITARWFQTIHAEGRTRVMRPLPPSGP